MTTLAKFAIAVLMALFLSSCVFDMNFGEGKRGNGDVVKDDRQVTQDFTIISASEGLDVYVTQGDDFEIMVEADENIIDLIGTDIKNGKLRIHAIENIGRATKMVYVTLPTITELSASSGSDLVTKNMIRADKISLGASSGAGMKIELVAEDVDADSSSGA
ncbi:MAG: DUF2807 domain-containing protein, partial [Eudoraea sp.]|nr:DUF2807 domain-containing protein [Eudoraea sp.]